MRTRTGWRAGSAAACAALLVAGCALVAAPAAAASAPPLVAAPATLAGGAATTGTATTGTATTGTAGDASGDAASCSPLDVAAVVAAGEPLVVGRAAEEVNGFTRVEVEQVWSGPDVAPDLWLVTGQQQTQRFGRVDASTDLDLPRGSDYVIAFDDDYRTDACRVRTVSDAVLATEPPGARDPVAGAATGATPYEAPFGGVALLAYVLVGALGLAVVVVVFAEARRRARAARAG